MMSAGNSIEPRLLYPRLLIVYETGRMVHRSACKVFPRRKMNVTLAFCRLLLQSVVCTSCVGCDRLVDECCLSSWLLELGYDFN